MSESKWSAIASCHLERNHDKGHAAEEDYLGGLRITLHTTLEASKRPLTSITRLSFRVQLPTWMLNSAIGPAHKSNQPKTSTDKFRTTAPPPTPRRTREWHLCSRCPSTLLTPPHPPLSAWCCQPRQLAKGEAETLPINMIYSALMTWRRELLPSVHQPPTTNRYTIVNHRSHRDSSVKIT